MPLTVFVICYTLLAGGAKFNASLSCFGCLVAAQWTTLTYHGSPVSM